MQYCGEIKKIATIQVSSNRMNAKYKKDKKGCVTRRSENFYTLNNIKAVCEYSLSPISSLISSFSAFLLYMNIWTLDILQGIQSRDLKTFSFIFELPARKGNDIQYLPFKPDGIFTTLWKLCFSFFFFFLFFFVMKDRSRDFQGESRGRTVLLTHLNDSRAL